MTRTGDLERRSRAAPAHRLASWPVPSTAASNHATTSNSCLRSATNRATNCVLPTPPRPWTTCRPPPSVRPPPLQPTPPTVARALRSAATMASPNGRSPKIAMRASQGPPTGTR